MHRGRPLRHWVSILGVFSSQGGQLEQAVDALTRAGTNALPFLVRWIQYEPRPSRERSAHLIAPIAPQSLTERLTFPRRERLAEGATFAFKLIGKDATTAMPQLVSLMNNPAAPDTAERAAQALSYIGTNALPPLLAVIDNPKHPCREAAVMAVEGMHKQLGPCAEMVVPHLIPCLTDPADADVQSAAATTLGRLRSAPDLAVPALAACLTSTNDILQVEAAGALGRFGSMATGAVPVLAAALKSPDQRLSWLARNALVKIAPETLTNAPPQ